MTQTEFSPSATPDAVLTDGIGRDALMEKCRVLEASVLRQPGVTQEMIDEKRPGSFRNPDNSAFGWDEFQIHLRILYSQGPEQPRAQLRWDATSMEDLRASLAAEALFIRLESGKQVGVYPKSEYALNRVMMIDLSLQWLLPQRVALQNVDEPVPAQLEALRAAVEWQSVLEREFVWIITHPGADVPWPDSGRWDHESPEWTRELTTYDLIALRKAHVDVNLLRINSVSERTNAIAGRSTDDAMPFAAFLGVMAGDLGISSVELSRRWSVGEIYAQACVKWQALQQEKARAEQRK